MTAWPTLLAFQKRFMRAVADPSIDTVCLSGPRGLGKTFLAGMLLSHGLTPGDPLHQPGKEYILGASSLEQARMTYAYVRNALEPEGTYRWIDSATRLGATHRPSNTKLRAISSNAKTALGLVNVPLVCLDEPGALENTGGAALADALFTAQGKPGSKLKLVLIGTLAPQGIPGHWWHTLINRGSVGSTWVECFQGRADRWDDMREIVRVNPLARIDPGFRAKLREERDAARSDTRLRARFLSYRLNLPAGDESEMLLTVDDWQRAIAREPGERVGRPIFAVDLGAGRAWSAAVAIWQSGVVDCIAVAPGLPDLAAQEKRDNAPAGLYRRLAQQGALMVADGLRVQPPAMLMDLAASRWGEPEFILCDRFRVNDLMDWNEGHRIPILPRVSRWSESSSDIRGTRKIVKDGPLSVCPDALGLLTASLAIAKVQNDDAGNVRLIKRGAGNSARDDCVSALVLAGGAYDRARGQWQSEPAEYIGIVD